MKGAVRCRNEQTIISESVDSCRKDMSFTIDRAFDKEANSELANTGKLIMLVQPTCIVSKKQVKIEPNATHQKQIEALTVESSLQRCNQAKSPLAMTLCLICLNCGNFFINNLKQVHRKRRRCFSRHVNIRHFRHLLISFMNNLFSSKNPQRQTSLDTRQQANSRNSKPSPNPPVPLRALARDIKQTHPPATTRTGAVRDEAESSRSLSRPLLRQAQRTEK